MQSEKLVCLIASLVSRCFYKTLLILRNRQYSLYFKEPRK